MQPIEIKALPPALQAQIMAKIQAENVRLIKPVQSANPNKADKKLERELQSQAEGWLANRGYARMTAENIEAGPPLAGYQFHLHKAKGNPVLLDILLLRPDGKYMMIELKVKPVRYQPGQEALIARGYGKLCTTFEELVDAVENWEMKG